MSGLNFENLGASKTSEELKKELDEKIGEIKNEADFEALGEDSKTAKEIEEELTEDIENAE